MKNLFFAIAAVITLMSGRSVASNQCAVDCFFTLGFVKNGTVGNRLFSVELDGETIFNNFTVYDSPGSTDVFQEVRFARPVVPGRPVKLRVMTGTDLRMTGTVHLPDGLAAEVDGALAGAIQLNSSSVPVNQVWSVMLRDIDVIAGSKESPLGLASDLAIGDAYWQTGLGILPGGRPAGFLTFCSDNLEASRITRAGLAVRLGTVTPGQRIDFPNFSSSSNLPASIAVAHTAAFTQTSSGVVMQLPPATAVRTLNLISMARSTQSITLQSAGGDSISLLPGARRQIRWSGTAWKAVQSGLILIDSGDVITGYDDTNSDGIADKLRFVKTPQAFLNASDLASPQTGFELLFSSQGSESPTQPGSFVKAAGALDLVRYRFVHSASGANRTVVLTQDDVVAGSFVTRRTNTATTTPDDQNELDWTLDVSGGTLNVRTAINRTKVTATKKEVQRTVSYTAGPPGLPSAANQSWMMTDTYESLSASGSITNIVLLHKLTERKWPVYDAPGQVRKERFSYYTDAADEAQFGLLRSKDNHFGEWVHYSYMDIKANNYDTTIEALAAWALDGTNYELRNALMPFHRRLALSTVPFGDSFAFDVAQDFDPYGTGVGNGGLVISDHLSGVGWKETVPGEISTISYHKLSNGNYVRVGIHDLDPVVFPTSYAANNANSGPDQYGDFVLVARRRMQKDNTDFPPPPPAPQVDKAVWDMMAQYVPHAMDSQFDSRKAFKPAYSLEAAGAKQVFGYTPISGYPNASDGSWAEIQVTGTGASRPDNEYYMNLSIPNYSTPFEHLSLQVGMSLVNVLANSKNVRRNAYFGDDGTPGVIPLQPNSAGPFDELWTASQLVENGITFTGMDSVTLINGKSRKSLRIFNNRGELKLVENYILDSSGAWQLTDRIRSEYDLFSRVTGSFISRDGGATERRLYGCAYSGLRKINETDETGVLTEYGFDGFGRVISKTASCAHGLAGLPPSVSTIYEYDALNRTVKTSGNASAGDTIAEMSILDSEGLLVKTINPSGLTSTLTYDREPGAGRRVTTVHPDLSTHVKVHRRDGRLLREDGTSIVSHYYSYSYDAVTGQMTGRVDAGYSAGSALPHPFALQTKDFTDRITRKVVSGPAQSPTGPATQAEILNFYNDKNQLAYTLETRLELGASTGSTTLRTVYEYDLQGNLIRAGLDRNGNGVLNPQSTDRYGESDFLYVTVPASPTGDLAHLEPGTYVEWSEKELVKDNSANSFTARRHEKLSGLGGTTISKAFAKDLAGNVIISQTSLNLATGVSTSTISFGGDGTSETISGAMGLTAWTTNTQGHTSSFAYDALGRIVLEKNPRGFSHRTTYQLNNGRVAAYTTGLALDGSGTGRTISYFYNSKGQMDRTRNAHGHWTFAQYNDRNQLLRQWGDAVSPVEYRYDAVFGRLQTQHTFRNADGSVDFSTAGSNPEAAAPAWPATAGDGSVTKFDYEPWTGALSTRIDDFGGTNRTTSTVYDVLGRRLTVTFPSSAANPASNTTATLPVVAKFQYDPDTGEMVQERYEEKGSLRIQHNYSYERTGGVNVVTENNGTISTRSYKYNLDPAGPSESALGLLSEDLPSYYTSFANAAGGADTSHRVNRLEYSYTTSSTDGMRGRLKRIRLGNGSPGGTTLTSSSYSSEYSYLNGRLNTVSSEALPISYTYVPQSNLIDTRTTPGSVPHTEKRTYEPLRNLLQSIETRTGPTDVRLRYAYMSDALGRRTSSTQSGRHFDIYGGALHATYGYNSRNEVTSVNVYKGSNNSGGRLAGRCFSWTFDDAGNRKTQTDPDAPAADKTTSYTANNLNQYTGRTNPDWSIITGTAPVSQNVSVAQVVGGQQTNAAAANRFEQYFFRYMQPRPVGETGPAEHKGRIQGVTPGAGSMDPISGLQRDLLEQRDFDMEFRARNEVFLYDARGNLTQDSFYIYEWDVLNRLISITPTAAARMAGVRTEQLEFAYDYLNRRVKKVVRDVNPITGVLSQPKSTILFYWQGFDLIYEAVYGPATANNFTMERKYYWGLDWSGSLSGAGGVGGLIATTRRSASGTVSGAAIPSYDGNGNLLAVYDSSGTSLAEFEYGPYGQLVRMSGSLPNEFPFRFATKYYDSETKLYYYNHRYYSPELGRFLSRDPIGEAGGMNLYAFVNNNPANAVDALGMATLSFGEASYLSYTWGDVDGHYEGNKWIDSFSFELWEFSYFAGGLIPTNSVNYPKGSVVDPEGSAVSGSEVAGGWYNPNQGFDRIDFGEFHGGASPISFGVDDGDFGLTIAGVGGRDPFAPTLSGAMGWEAMMAIQNSQDPFLAAAEAEFNSRATLPANHPDNIWNYRKEWVDGVREGPDGFWEQKLVEASHAKNEHAEAVLRSQVANANVARLQRKLDFAINLFGMAVDLPLAAIAKSVSFGTRTARFEAASVGLRSEARIAANNGIALGVTKHPGHTAGGLLERFSGHVDAKWYQQWDNYADFQQGRISLQGMIDSNMARADALHFNLDGMNLHKFANWMNKRSDLSVQRLISNGKDVTNYELRSIIQNPSLSGKATFYDPGGSQVSFGELMQRLQGFGLK